jgi:hypothetical protein
MDAPIPVNPLQVVERKQGIKEKPSNETPDGNCPAGYSCAKSPRALAAIHPIAIRLFKD